MLRLYAARIRKIMDLVVNEDPRVRYAEDGEGDAAEPVGEPCDKASANDARSGGGDGVRARATAGVCGVPRAQRRRAPRVAPRAGRAAPAQAGRRRALGRPSRAFDAGRS